MIDLVSYAQRNTDEHLLMRVDETVDIEHRSLVDALVLMIVGMIDHGAADAWGALVNRLAADDS